jgi:hypothetical protein
MLPVDAIGIRVPQPGPMAQARCRGDIIPIQVAMADPFAPGDIASDAAHEALACDIRFRQAQTTPLRHARHISGSHNTAFLLLRVRTERTDVSCMIQRDSDSA